MSPLQCKSWANFCTKLSSHPEWVAIPFFQKYTEHFSKHVEKEGTKQLTVRSDKYDSWDKSSSPRSNGGIVGEEINIWLVGFMKELGFRRDMKEGKESTRWTKSGKLFQTQGVACKKV